MKFDIDPWGKYLVTGSQNGKVLVYDTDSFELVSSSDSVGNECVNAAVFHPFSALVLASTGQRHFLSTDSSSDDDSDEELSSRSEIPNNSNSSSSSNRDDASINSSIQIWSLPYNALEMPADILGDVEVPAEMEVGNDSIDCELELINTEAIM